MPLDKNIVDKQINALGEFSRVMTRKEIRSLPEILRTDEVILAMTSGQYKDNRNYLLIVTSHRVLCLRKGIIFGLVQAELPLSQVSGIAHKTGLLFGEIIATTSGGAEYLKMIQKRDVVRFASALSEAVNTVHSKKRGIIL